MKKITILTLFTAFLFVGVTANAQEQGDIRVTAGLAIGTKAGIDDHGSSKIGLGLNVGGEYLVTDVISVAPSYTLFFKSEVQGGAVSNQFSSFNLDGRYYFSDGKFYGLAGLSFASVTAKADFGFGSVEETDSTTGLNLGGGTMIPLGDTMFLNGQVKYNTPLEQLDIQVGIAFGF